MAEREGFEPSVQVTLYDDLANRCFRPLSHLSAAETWSNQKLTLIVKSAFNIARRRPASTRRKEFSQSVSRWAFSRVAVHEMAFRHLAAKGVAKRFHREVVQRLGGIESLGYRVFAMESLGYRDAQNKKTGKQNFSLMAMGKIL